MVLRKFVEANGVINEICDFEMSAEGICYNPPFVSISLENTFAPLSCVNVSANFDRGCTYVLP